MKANRPSLKQQIVQDMVQGYWNPGDRLTLNEMALRYQSSHTPVREALRELYGEGFLVMGAGKTFQLRTLDSDFIENIFDIRSNLEVMLVRKAASNCRAADLIKLETLNQQLADDVEGRDFAAAIQKNGEFHDHINHLAGNPEAVRILRMHWIFIASLWKKIGYGEERYRGVIHDHQAIIQAFRFNDSEAAATLMGAHVTKAKYELLAKLLKNNNHEEM